MSYVKKVRRPRSEGKKLVQFEETSEEVKPEEDCKMEVDSDPPANMFLSSSCVRSRKSPI